MNCVELLIFGEPIRIVSDDRTAASTVSSCYSAFLNSIPKSRDASIEVQITSQARDQWSVKSRGELESCTDLADLIYVVEKVLTIELQHRRPDLFFMHAAALAHGDRCVVIAGASGAGKSTLCWELCNAGFTYMSDELAPIDLATMQVEPYPHSICLKQIVEGMTPLPAETLDAGVTLHVPAEAVPGVAVSTTVTLAALIFLEDLTKNAATGLVPVSRAEAAARIYSNGLNQLAHAEDGLEAAAALAAIGPSFRLAKGELSELCNAVKSIFAN